LIEATAHRVYFV